MSRDRSVRLAVRRSRARLSENHFRRWILTRKSSSSPIRTASGCSFLAICVVLLATSAASRAVSHHSYDVYRFCVLLTSNFRVQAALVVVTAMAQTRRVHCTTRSPRRHVATNKRQHAATSGRRRVATSRQPRTATRQRHRRNQCAVSHIIHRANIHAEPDASVAGGTMNKREK